MTLLAGWGALLARLSGQPDVVIGTPVANRGRSEIEELIGFFVNTLALRLDLSGSATVGELLQQVKAQTIAAQQHQDIPFEQVVELVRPVRSLAHSPLFQVMFVWQNAPEGTLRLPGLELTLQSTLSMTAKFDLTLYLQQAGPRIMGGLEYATSLFERATIQRYLGHFRTLLTAMVADDTQGIDRLPLLSATERQQVLYEWNDTAADFPRDRCVHELFEEQVARTPDAVAVVFEDQQLSYAELNCRANQLAHYLRGLGVGAEVRVGICVERSLEMVVGLLGILKAGGAYVPLDPGYPAERLAYMLEDSKAAILITQRGMAGGLPEVSLGRVYLDSDWGGIEQSPDGVVCSNAHGGNLAYVIYTSGSTGRPKAVGGVHSGVLNRIGAEVWNAGISGEEVCCQKTSLGFVDAVAEIWSPLLSGGKLVVASESTVKDPEALVELIRREGITRLVTVPTLARAMVESAGARWGLKSLRSWTLSGEALALELFRQLRQSLPECRFLNLYGSSEVSADATWYAGGEGELEGVGYRLDDRWRIRRCMCWMSIWSLCLWG